MKFITIALVAFAAALSALGASSPAATQSWVRNYVATNTANDTSTGFNVSPISAPVTNELGEAETITLTFGNCRNAAMVVEDSTVAGMTNGTLFARVGNYAYRNAANSACTDFSGANDTFGSVATGGRLVVSTNGVEVVTNAVYSATNEVWMVRYVAQVGANVYQSVRVKPGVHLFRSATTDGAFTMRECLVTDATRARLVAPRTSFILCLTSLLCQSAYAATPGEKIPDHDEQGDGFVRHWWTRHQYTDSTEAKHIVVDKVSITSASGAEVSYELDVVLLDIPQGVDFCSIADYATVSTEEEINAAIEAAVGRNRAIQLKRSSEWHEHLAAKLEQVNAIIDSVNDVTCPETGYDDEELPPEPIPPDEHVCKFFEGHCGAWTCVECHTWYESVEDDPDHPAEHSFAATEDGGACQICTICKSRPDKMELHGGWHDAVTISGVGRVVVEFHVCVCDCERFVLSHGPKSQTIRFVESLRNPNTCWEVWECLRCGETVEPDNYEIVDDQHDGGYTISAGGHNELHDSKYSAVTVENPHTGEDVDVCRCTYTCHHFRNFVDLGCGAARTEDFEHLPKAEAALATRPLDETYHEIAVPCGNGFISWNNTTNWCGYTFNTNEEHRIGFSEVIPWDDPDYPATRTHHAFLKVCGHRNMSEELKIDPRNHECGMEIVTNQTHAFIGASSYGDPDATTHAVSNYCYKCNGTFLAYPDGREQHVPTKGAATYSYVDMASHIVTNVCARCDATYVVGDGLEPHEPEYRDGEIVRSCAYLTETEHVVSNCCRKCESWFLAGIEDHVPMYESPAPEDEYVRCKPLADWTHETFVPCERCMKPTTNGLEYVWIMLGTNECSKAWRLGEATNSADVVYCEFERHGCDNSTSTNHAWNAENDLFHWCENGGGHLNGGHIYPEYVAGAKCTVCGHEYVPPPPSCEHCECTEPRGQNYICTSWDHELQRCRCNHCDNMAEGYDDGELCYCERALVVDNITYWLTKRSGGKAEILSFFGDDGRADGDVVIPDSVEKDGARYTVTTICENMDAADIDEGSLITSISAGENLTSIENGGLHGHFQMASASFPGVTTIGDNAFLGCTALTNVFIPAVTSVGEFAFKYDHSIRSMECPEMVTIGTNAFGYSWGITNACFPKATHIAPGAFDSAGKIHLHLGQTVVTCETEAENFAAIHFPSNKTLNGVVYPAESIYFGGGHVPIVWEVPAQ